MADGTVRSYRYRNRRGRSYICGDCRSAVPPPRGAAPVDPLAVVERRMDRLELRVLELEARSRAASG